MKIKFLNHNLIKRCCSVGTALVMLSTPLTAGATEHIVKKGDTLAKISKKYYGTISYYDELAKYNKIENPDVINSGQIIKIPEVEDLKEIIEYYVIKKGDTLSKISKKFYNSPNYWQKLAIYNNIENADILRTGDVLAIPQLWILNHYEHDCQDEQLQTEVSYHTVKKGDTLWKICDKYYGNGKYYQALARYNRIENPNILNSGDKLLIPKLETLKLYMNNSNNSNNNSSVNNSSLDKISKKHYKTDKYGYLLALINGVSKYGNYNEEELFIPKEEYLDNYLEVLNRISKEDTLSNYYIVQKGDTLRKISILKYGTDKYIDFLADINGISNENKIYSGDVLYTPGMYHENNKKLVK